MIELKNITRTFGKGDAEVKALRGVNLAIEDGEMIAIMGPSGSGKTTLLNILGCLDKPTRGSYILDGLDIGSVSSAGAARLRNEVFGFVLQDNALIDEYTVYENVELPVRYAKKRRKNAYEDILALLERLGIAEKRAAYPNQLSGGQKQRTAIARAVVNEPKFILADEPTGALDQKCGREIVALFREMNREGKTVIIVTHDMSVADACDRIVRIEDGVIVR